MADFVNISANELPELIASGNAQLVDVRTDAEIARGRIKGAISMPLHLLPLRLQELNNGKTTVFYCHVGGRSAQAAAFAAGQGLQGAANLQGGILAWAQSGGEIVA
ncbi:MAG TPA: sulfurtransferase [Gallionellaceae bacterium]|nr:sulfurtransferase [Gallionellaceae bacterium]